MTAVSQFLFTFSKRNSRFSTAVEIFFSVFACCFFLKKEWVCYYSYPGIKGSGVKTLVILDHHLQEKNKYS